MSFFILLLHLYELCQLGARNYRFRVQVLTNLQILFFDYELTLHTLWLETVFLQSHGLIFEITSSWDEGKKIFHYVICHFWVILACLSKKEPKTWRRNHPSQKYNFVFGLATLKFFHGAHFWSFWWEKNIWHSQNIPCTMILSCDQKILILVFLRSYFIGGRREWSDALSKYCNLHSFFIHTLIFRAGMLCKESVCRVIQCSIM